MNQLETLDSIEHKDRFFKGYRPHNPWFRTQLSKEEEEQIKWQRRVILEELLEERNPDANTTA